MPVLLMRSNLALPALIACMHAAPARAHELTLVVEGVSNTRGVIGVLVFNSPSGWPERVSSAFRSTAVPAESPETVLAIPNVPAGRYAVVVLHDENSNKKLERDWLGRPQEQWGMSNNPRVFLSAPSFESARFSLDGDATLHIRLHRARSPRRRGAAASGRSPGG